MSGDQIPSLPGKKRRQIPGVCPEGMLKRRFDWYITNITQCFSIVFVRGGQRRFSSIVSVVMSGLKVYTIFAARHCRRSRDLLLVFID